LQDRLAELEGQVEVAPMERRQGIRHELLTTAARLDAAKNAVMAASPP
jgi:hypothetical protein